VYLERRADVVLPVGYNRTSEYPVFVVLPPTGLEAAQVAQYLGLDPQRQEDFILILPAGRPARSEYLPDFPTFVEWYEERVLAELGSVLENYSADPERVYLGGYSLGGDLSWALSVRNPELFAGAVIAGSRTSYPVEAATLETLREHDFRASFLIGDRESPARYDGINRSRTAFANTGIEHRYREYRGAHVIPPPAVFQDEIVYVTQVTSLPDPATPAVPTRTVRTALFGHTSRDRFALRFALPVELSAEGFSGPSEAEIAVRAEWPWERLYLRTAARYTSSRRTTGDSENALDQYVLVAGGGSRHMLGAGFGWDWYRGFREGDSYHRYDLIAVHGMRNPWIIPAGRADPLRMDMLTLLRYRIPRGIGAGPAVAQLLNLQVEYLLRITDRVVLDAGAGSYTVQNRPVKALAELSGALDHRLEWSIGAGLRAPSPLLWRVGYRGIGERALPDGERTYRGLWNLTLEFSY
jgi:pimeloyl-ACP methyl ester carboxylesterase